MLVDISYRVMIPKKYFVFERSIDFILNYIKAVLMKSMNMIEKRIFCFEGNNERYVIFPFVLHDRAYAGAQAHTNRRTRKRANRELDALFKAGLGK
jgi:hypothetical protein